MSLQGRKIVFTGPIPGMPRKKAIALAQAAGAFVQTQVTPFTNFLITDSVDSITTKEKAATKFGIPRLRTLDFSVLVKRPLSSPSQAQFTPGQIWKASDGQFYRIIVADLKNTGYAAIAIKYVMGEKRIPIALCFDTEGSFQVSDKKVTLEILQKAPQE